MCAMETFLQSQADAFLNYDSACFGIDTIGDPTNGKVYEGQSPPDVRGYLSVGLQ